jgi:raffinose/stachyose/melibiose transport system permease protein
MADNKQNIEYIKNKNLLSRKWTNTLTVLAFLSIPFIIYTVFVIIPVLQAAVFSLYKWNGLGPLTDFRGFKNFSLILQDRIFHKAIFNNIMIIILSLLLQLPTALILALLIGRDIRGKYLFRGIFFLPYILADVIAGLIWYFIYHPQFGISNSFLSKLFPILNSIALLGDPKTVFYAIFVAIWWKYFGLHMVIYIAGLQSIPVELEEAAYVDGANNFQLIWHIILPLLKPTIKITIFFSIIGSLQTFDIIWAMGKGDPINSAETMVTYLFKFGFQRFSLGYGSAVAIIIFLICLVFNGLYQKLVIRKGEIY